MPSHVLVNGLGLTYKSTIGISIATIPDVCKTPSPGGPIPIPYPNIANQGTLGSGTTTVKAKGKMIAIKGSQYKSSNGDEPGTAGGVKSNVNMKATDWITYSFDVKMDGKNACRHTDKKFHNNQNTVDLGGNLDPALVGQFGKWLCVALQDCTAQADGKNPSPLTGAWCKKKGSGDFPSKAAERGAEIDACVEKKISDEKAKGPDPVFDEVKTQEWVNVPVLGGACRPDIIVGKPRNCDAVFDVKTSCPPLPKGAPPPKWPVYGDGGFSAKQGCYTRKASRKSWHGYSQKDIAHLACGAEPQMVHENSETCK
ncbi:DUF4150 domain-containing protein [Ruegeria sp. PrR005]|uniref:DUF4150 domain-containing protein n=1 Tax=Ruegeria sp. PrR005 TaxID=2706882 RepID=A0A6B2NQ83_9RHOB|nr:DUF4150 domain-containing protein [Ruegeria sp. PrR005]NDW45538.1 DUF4150 domain-containing protein [Ruegeria sp. PrR005]